MQYKHYSFSVLLRPVWAPLAPTAPTGAWMCECTEHGSRQPTAEEARIMLCTGAYARCSVIKVVCGYDV